MNGKRAESEKMIEYKKVKAMIKDYYADMMKTFNSELNLPEEMSEQIVRSVICDLFDDIHRWMEESKK